MNVQTSYQSLRHSFPFRFFGRSTKVGALENLVSLRVVPELQGKEKTPESPGSTTSSESGQFEVSVPEITLKPLEMKVAKTLRLIADYFFFLDAVPASSKKDESTYQHNKAIISDMIRLDGAIAHLPDSDHAEKMADYLLKIKRYDAAIYKKRLEFQPKRTGFFGGMLPKVRGKKSEALVYLFLKYLNCTESGNKAVDAARAKERGLVIALHTQLEPKVKLNKTDKIVIDMYDAITLRKKRLAACSSPKLSELELQIRGTDSDIKRDEMLRKALLELSRLNKRVAQKMLDDVERYPAVSEEAKRNFRSDLHYSYAKDAYLLIARYSNKDLLKSLSESLSAEVKEAALIKHQAKLITEENEIYDVELSDFGSESEFNSESGSQGDTDFERYEGNGSDQSSEFDDTESDIESESYLENNDSDDQSSELDEVDLISEFNECEDDENDIVSVTSSMTSGGRF